MNAQWRCEALLLTVHHGRQARSTILNLGNTDAARQRLGADFAMLLSGVQTPAAQRQSCMAGVMEPWSTTT